MAPPALTENDYTLNKFRWLNAFTVENFSATVGVDYKSEDGQTSGYLSMFGQNIPTNYQLSRTNLAGFIDAKVDLAEASVFFGVRLDKPEDKDNETTWKLGVNYPLNNNLRLFANTGEAYKLPSLYALSNNLIGNAELAPETAKNADFGVEWTNDTTDISLSIFDYHYKNLIDFDGETFSLVNRSSVKTQGAELILSSKLTNNSTLKANVTYADVEAGEGELLSGRPQWQGGVSANWQWTDDFSTYVSANYVGESSATSLHVGDFSVGMLPSYNKFDVSANWHCSEQLNVDFFLTNALDKKYYYAVGFTGPERSVGIKLNWELW
jgi:iron complex outermembrane receptor protein